MHLPHYGLDHLQVNCRFGLVFQLLLAEHWEPAQIVFFKSLWVYNLLSAVIPPLYMIWLNIWTPQRKSSEIELGKFCYFQSLANITFSFLPMDWKYQHKAKEGLKILQFRIKILHLWYSYTINIVAVSRFYYCCGDHTHIFLHYFHFY